MSNLIYSFLVSLDGYIADDAGGFGWAVPDGEVMDFINEFEAGVGTYLYGRRMYEMMTPWETDPALAAYSPQNAQFARMWQGAEKVVYSRTLEAVSTSRTRVERDFDPGRVAAMKDEAGQDLTISGSGLAAAAWAAELVDQCHLFIAPVLVGGGKAMFPHGLRRRLELLERRGFGNGMVFLRYRVVHHGMR